MTKIISNSFDKISAMHNNSLQRTKNELSLVIIHRS